MFANVLGSRDSAQVIRMQFFANNLFIYFQHFCSPRNSLNFLLATLLCGHELSAVAASSPTISELYLTLIFAVSRSPNSLSFLFLRKSCSFIHFLSVSLHESNATRTVGRKKRFHQSTVKTNMAP